MAKKAPIYIITAILLAVALCISPGCSDRATGTNQTNKPDLGAMSRTEVVEIIPSGAEIPGAVLSSKSEVSALTTALEVENWKLVDKPQNQIAYGKIRFLGTETAKLGESFADKHLQEVGSITVFTSEPVVCFTAPGINLYFEIPRQAYSYLLDECSIPPR